MSKPRHICLYFGETELSRSIFLARAQNLNRRGIYIGGIVYSAYIVFFFLTSLLPAVFLNIYLHKRINSLEKGLCEFRWQRPYFLVGSTHSHRVLVRRPVHLGSFGQHVPVRCRFKTTSLRRTSFRSRRRNISRYSSSSSTSSEDFDAKGQSLYESDSNVDVTNKLCLHLSGPSKSPGKGKEVEGSIAERQSSAPGLLPDARLHGQSGFLSSGKG